VQNAFESTGSFERVEILLGIEGERATVKVADDGPGMTPEFIRERLFRPFESTKASGLGVGAYESRQYARELGGDLTVESDPTVRTVFTLWLPLALQNAPAAPPKPSDAGKSATNAGMVAASGAVVADR
jgi:signal transduction histidine kinase